MKVESSTRTIVGMLVIVGLAVAFWVLLIGPKRSEANELSSEVTNLRATLAQQRSALSEAQAARREFANNYQQLVVLGKAVPAGDDTPSLLVQINHIADQSHVKFNSITLAAAEGSEATEAPTSSSTSTETVPPTEAEASLLPLGASIGPAGLGIMPYDLSFSGSFFNVADFIKGVDQLVETENSKIAVDGRLITLNGFSLSAGAKGFPSLNANFSVTTYVVPPNQGLTAAASATEPGEATETSEAGTTSETSETAETSESETTEGTASASVEGAK